MTELTEITKKFVNEADYLKRLTEDEKLFLRIQISILMMDYSNTKIKEYKSKLN